MTDTPARSPFGTIVNLLFGYDGRIGRLYCFVGFLAFCAIVGFFSSIAEDATAGTGDIGRYVALVFIVGTGVWMHSAVTIKRLHDRDKSAAWYLVFGVAPLGVFIAAIYFYGARAFEISFILFFVSIAGLIWAIVDLGFLRGTPGANRFGPAP